MKKRIMISRRIEEYCDVVVDVPANWDDDTIAKVFEANWYDQCLEMETRWELDGEDTTFEVVEAEATDQPAYTIDEDGEVEAVNNGNEMVGAK